MFKEYHSKGDQWRPAPREGLYERAHEHDACGVGLIAHVEGKASHGVLEAAITGLKNLAHRGAIDADAVTGDGAGVMTQLPYALLEEHLAGEGKRVPRERMAAGMFFMDREDADARNKGMKIVAEALLREGLELVSWREVPIDNYSLGRKAEATRPAILQAVISASQEIGESSYDRRLLLAQKACGRMAMELGLSQFYVVSLSRLTITYKGLLNAPQVRKFFLDLRDTRYETNFCIFHQRFATNTFPDWSKAQPFRMMAHNGEINTIRGNRANMQARESSADHGIWGDRFRDLAPMIQESMSDSASFDNCLQLMTVGGRNPANGVAIMMPMAWESNFEIPESLRNFYKYHAVVMEPWDGPAAVVFSDGKTVGAALDRNGLRPARFTLYADGMLVLASEAGLVPRSSQILRAGRLGPGRMLAVDLEAGRLFEDTALKLELAQGANYGKWCEESIESLSELTHGLEVQDYFSVDPEEITALRVALGYDLDEENVLLKPMILEGKEAIGSMGDDTPLAVLSRRPRLLYTYFKQLFAQVTNPAIDSLRERSVMSLKMHLGGRLSLFDDLVQEHSFVALESPVLLDHEFAALEESKSLKGKMVKLSALFPVAEGPDGLLTALKELREKVRKSTDNPEIRVVVISDRGIQREYAGIPMLLAVGAVQTELVRMGRRIRCDIVVESGEVRDVHQMACVLGFGANAVVPYLALDMIRKIVAGKDLGAEENAPADLATAMSRYRKAIDGGILKIMSKMGISTLFSYQGAKIFEALGVSQRVVDECFPGTACPIDGIGYREIAIECLVRHQDAFPENGSPVALSNEGYLTVQKKGPAEYHAWSSKVVSGMNAFLRKKGEFSAFASYRESSDSHPPVTIKDLLRLRLKRGQPLALEEVEPVEVIRKRFTTAGMSLGALSPEMHETLAIAMNAIGGKSNSGEGGEDPRRYRPFEDGRNANSAIKQVASGRFGVTAEYLANAKEIEIKVAQGAKPGEGGQLMGWKVTPLIAGLRYSVPGVTLISPPPHHDIYSIEDLAQLIFDLKEVNPRAKVCVKLVSSSGVGTIAAGVAKAYADVILISGHDGGTGASPISSIKHAGSAWEIGLSEAHQVLMLNDLRTRVILRTDGGMKTGRDILVAALLGAEEFNFGTAALIAGGCAMFRVCHLNTCPVGVATQREDLRAKFRGKPEYIIQYFNAVAHDVRSLMAKLGYRRMDELIGRTDELEPLTDPRNPKSACIRLDRVLHTVDATWEAPRIHTRARNDRFGSEGSLDDTVLQDAKETVAHLSPTFRGSYLVENTNRNIGTHLSGEIAYLHGNRGMPPGTVHLLLKGSAGQGMGTFLVQGMRLELRGEANDYVGKGMNGGEIILRPSDESAFIWHLNTIMGNTCLYGATGGHLFAAGQAGERFAVRNSGATAVVEGVGDHGCEYMTGGFVVCLGGTGRNFGAGMSGGAAFVYDPENFMPGRINPEMVELEKLDDNGEIHSLKRLILLHHHLTRSPLAEQILHEWDQTLGHFQRVSPLSTADAPKSRFGFDENLQLMSQSRP